MVTLIKYGALSGGEKYNVNALSLDGLSTDTKPTRTYIEYGSDGREVGRMGIPNGSIFTEIDTGDTYMYDADNTTWHKVSIGGGGGGGFTPTQAQLDAMNSGINSTKVAQITTNENNILSVEAELIDRTTISNEIECTFIQGSITSNSGRIDSSRTNRIVDEKYYPTKNLKSITFGSSYSILLAYYTSATDSTFVQTTGWLTEPVTSFSYPYVRIVVKNRTEGTILPTASTDTTLTYSQKLKDYTIELGNAASSCCPNIIWQSRDVGAGDYPPFSKEYVKRSAHGEFDRVLTYVRKTTDGYYVSIHDDTINNEARNSDGSRISTTISSNGQSLAVLNSYDWGIKYGQQYAGMGVPMVEDMMKWASMYNLGLTVHFSYGFSQQDAQNIYAMAYKYGLADNLIVLPSGGLDFTGLGYFKTLNKKISYYCGCTYDNLVANITDITGLLTGENKVYCQPYPWGTIADTTYREYAMSHGLNLLNSTIMSDYDLFTTVGFDKGYTIIETAGIDRIKTTVRNYVDNANG